MQGYYVGSNYDAVVASCLSSAHYWLQHVMMNPFILSNSARICLIAYLPRDSHNDILIFWICLSVVPPDDVRRHQAVI